MKKLTKIAALIAFSLQVTQLQSLEQLDNYLKSLKGILKNLVISLKKLHESQTKTTDVQVNLDTFKKIQAEILKIFKRNIPLTSLTKGDISFTAHNLPTGAFKLTDDHMRTLIPILEQLDKLIRFNKLLTWLKRFNFVAKEFELSDIIKNKYFNQLNVGPDEVIKLAKDSYKIDKKKWERESDTAEGNLKNDMRRAGIYNISFHGNSLTIDPTKKLKEKLFHQYLQLDFYGNPFTK